MIGNEKVWEGIERLRIEETVDSDYFPVAIWIKGEGTRKKRGGEKTK